MNSPIFAPIVAGLSLFRSCEGVPPLEEIQSKLSDAKVRFVPQAAKSESFEQGYEPRIYLKGEVQTRDNNWHDFFNALVWNQFPNAKREINALQYQMQRSHYPSKSRLPAENMLTLFDENGAIVVSANPYLSDLIQAHKWHELFWQRRQEVERDLSVIVFGHALYEKSMRPYVGLTAQCLLFSSLDSSKLDVELADYLGSRGTNLKTSDLDPVPILGVPGWWPENAHESFYANTNYFRS